MSRAIASGRSHTDTILQASVLSCPYHDMLYHAAPLLEFISSVLRGGLFYDDENEDSGMLAFHRLGHTSNPDADL